MKKIKLVYILVPIFIIIALIVFSQIWLFKENGRKTKQDDSQWKIKKVYLDTQTIDDIKAEIAQVQKWEEQSISQQFREVKYRNNEYSSKVAKISNDKIKEKIGTAVLTGYDLYNNMNYEKKASLYKIDNLLEECAIALQFEGDSNYYIYVNPFYRPATLKDFMKDLDLRQNVTFGTAYYQHWYTDNEGNKKYENIEFPDIDNNIVWQMLFDNLEIENVHSDSDWHNTIMSISVNIPLLGYKNISVSVTEEGYLTTNILDTGKAFYIGEDKVQKFVNYIVKNYDGYKTVYVDENGEEITQKEEKTENDVKEKIMVTENNTVESNTFNTTEYTIENKNVIQSNRTEANNGVNSEI